MCSTLRDWYLNNRQYYLILMSYFKTYAQDKFKKYHCQYQSHNVSNFSIMKVIIKLTTYTHVNYFFLIKLPCFNYNLEFFKVRAQTSFEQSVRTLVFTE